MVDTLAIDSFTHEESVLVLLRRDTLLLRPRISRFGSFLAGVNEEPLLVGFQQTQKSTLDAAYLLLIL